MQLHPSHPHQPPGASRITTKQDQINQDNSQSFLTWRCWKLDPASINKLVAADQPSSSSPAVDGQPANLDQQMNPADDPASRPAVDPLHELFRGGYWDKIPEIN
ncbi:uncharacterized protein PGTG_14411 [Puccinia graminis f. sp. tritici CRL 75-36-700-3]|uniref:Uncharacterized protein n=1 Tax=Puccinia graminis f. sp. tritici (strain CRL 75-36-700-3 / race SCCL) TaxID=418459 RepID=E3KVI7_PUCGT|nr:uncharacterized protein PGTG_14411 [Puccinia graminis f. sp. tritici CRL 75-36-700-3]EFP88327.2 hypothetical protein PGTG_14411 [Puccinia graminis f. sp. tritici CRL 75-36-700-3]